MIRQQGFQFAYILGAVNPMTGQHVGMIFEDLDTSVVNEHLQLISHAIPQDVHVLLVWDQAGFHKAKTLKVPDNISIFRLEPYSPELNPVERVWQWIKTHYLGNSVFSDVENLFQAGVAAWNKLTDELLTSVCNTDWLPRTN